VAGSYTGRAGCGRLLCSQHERCALGGARSAPVWERQGAAGSFGVLLGAASATLVRSVGHSEEAGLGHHDEAACVGLAFCKQART
jgi:hypothetical protein